MSLAYRTDLNDNVKQCKTMSKLIDHIIFYSVIYAYENIKLVWDLINK